MEINEQNWRQVRAIFRDAFKSSLHYSIATINDNGTPHITPIGGLFLKPDFSGYFSEIYARRLGENVLRNRKICVMAINSSRWFWLKSLVSGRFRTPPGVRLIGTAGDRRSATEAEIKAFHGRIKSRGFLRLLPFSRFKGYNLLWGNIKYVRDIRFTSIEPINLGAMSSWQQRKAAE